MPLAPPRPGELARVEVGWGEGVNESRTRWCGSAALPVNAACGRLVRAAAENSSPLGCQKLALRIMRQDVLLLLGNALDTRHVAVYHEALDREHEEYGAKPHSRASFRLPRHPSMLFAVKPTSGLGRHAISSSGSVRAWNVGLRQSWY